MSTIYYTYLIGWKSLGKFYYGAQYGKKAHPDNLWKTYFTSSKIVRKLRESSGEPDIIQIRKTFTCSQKCREWEYRVIRRLVNNPKYLNISANFKDKAIRTLGLTTVTDGVNAFLLPCKHQDIISGKVWSIMKGKTVVKDSNGNRMQVSVNDSRLLSGELVSVNRGRNYKPNSHNHLGKIWVTNGVTNKIIPLDDFESFAQSGFYRGKTQRMPNRDYSLPHPNKNKSWMTNGHTNRLVPQGEIDSLILAGFRMGKTLHKKRA